MNTFSVTWRISIVNQVIVVVVLLVLAGLNTYLITNLNLFADRFQTFQGGHCNECAKPLPPRKPRVDLEALHE